MTQSRQLPLRNYAVRDVETDGASVAAATRTAETEKWAAVSGSVDFPVGE